MPQPPKIGDVIEPDALEVGSEVDRSMLDDASIQATPDFSTKTTLADGLTVRDVATAPVRNYVNLTAGGLKSLGRTAVGTADMMLGASQALIPGTFGDAQRDEVRAKLDALKAQYLQNDNATQAIGGFATDVLTMLSPGKAVSRVATGVGKVLPKGAALAGRMAVEGAGGAAMSAAQGQSPEFGGIVGAAVPAIGAVARGGAALLQTANPALQKAVDYAKRRGLPVDWATEAGSPMLRRVQNLMGKGTLGGSLSEQRFERARQAGIAEEGKRLVGEAFPVSTGGSVDDAAQRVQDRAVRQIDRGVARRAAQINPESVSPVEFGESLPQTLEANVARSKGVQSQAYQEFEDAVNADPQRLTQWATPEQIAAAKPEQKAAARRLRDELNAQNSGKRVLQFIADQGGIRDVGDDLSGESRHLKENVVSNAQGGARNKLEIGGVQGVYNRQNGISPQLMLERIKNNPELAGPMGIDPNAVDELPDSAIFDIIDDAVYKAQRFRPVTFEQALGNVLTRTDDIGTPVSLQELKALVKPIYDEAADSLTPKQRDESVALNSMRQLIEGPDIVGAVRADKHLSALKRIVREGGEFPNIQTRGQALARKMIEQLEGDLAAGAERSGPGAMDALRRGREATKAMYATAEVLDQFKGEPVATFEKLAKPANKSLNLLRDVAVEAPSELPRLARAVVDDIHAKRDYGRWATYGRESKRILLGSDQMVDAMDRSMARWDRLESIAKGRGGNKSAGDLLRRLTGNGDTKLPELQALAKRMPHLGRAYLEDMFARATKNAEIKGQVNIFKDYEELGEGVKKALFPNPQLRSDLDDLVLYVRKTSEDRNPPGTAYMGALAAQAGALVSGGALGVIGLNSAGLVLSEIMHSPRAIKLLRNALEADKVGGAQSAAAIAAFQNYLAPYTARDAAPAPTGEKR